MDYNRCPECGMPLEPNAKKCTFCGKKVKPKKGSPATINTYGNNNTSNTETYAGPPYQKQNTQGSAGSTSNSNRYSTNPNPGPNTNPNSNQNTY